MRNKSEDIINKLESLKINNVGNNLIGFIVNMTIKNSGHILIDLKQVKYKSNLRTIRMGKLTKLY